MATRIVTRSIQTPLGPMLAGVTDSPIEPQPALCILEFADRPRLPQEINELHAAIGPLEEAGQFETGTPAIDLLDDVASQLADYFDQRRTAFDLPLVTPGTAFQQAVWNHLLTIPHGQNTTYGAIADALGRPGAQRAVGAANGANRISIVVPCHRVIDANGNLHGYGGGIGRKRKLLELEQATLFSRGAPFKSSSHSY
ncbi:MAG: methylated-DNA--[protein]-cysteine S-methyltransferase [Planctomycetota bacterium]